MHTHSPENLKKFKQSVYQKLMAAVFWNRRGVLMVKFVQKQNKRHGVLTSGIVLLH
jgi:hypothetical protein